MHNALIALSLLALTSNHGPQENPLHEEIKQERLLFLTHSAGYEHAVIKRESEDALSIAERGLISAAGKRYSVVASKDCSLINAKSLETFDAVLFYTTGELPIAKEQVGELIDWVAKGGAFVGIHCATDTLYESKAYMDMIGGAFDGHPWHEDVSLVVEDRTHPATAHLGDTWELKDEIYQFKWFQRFPLHALLHLSGSKADLSKGKREDGDYANSWCKAFGAGRVFYTALGHREELWSDKVFLEHLFGGIDWAINGPDTPVPAPTDAKQLMKGGDLTAWHHADQRGAEWETAQGLVTVKPGTGSLLTRNEFGDALIHVEFSPSADPEDAGWQGRGNSGVYLMGAYELQILDSFGLEPKMGDCGACYGVALPLVAPYRPAGNWSYYDIEFRSPRFDESGAKTENARLTAWLNGRKIHDDIDIPGPTGGAFREGEFATGPLMLQEHSNRVRFRNVWILPR